MTYCDRSIVFKAIVTERKYQDSLPATRREHRIMPLGEELLLLKEYLDRAIKNWTDAPGANPDIAKHDIRKLAGICVRALENHGAPMREGF